MPNLEFETGAQLWRDEVVLGGVSSVEVPYVAVLPLVGLYVALNNERPATSYAWRQTVLQTSDAMEGLRRGISNFFRYELTMTEEITVADEAPAADAAAQYKWSYHSLVDGLPDHITKLPWNEMFLAKHLGLAAHDQAVSLNPLTLTDQGLYAVGNVYPKTAAVIETSQ